MATDTVRAIAGSLQLTHTWLNEFRDELGFDTQDRAFKIMRAIDAGEYSDVMGMLPMTCARS